MEEFLKSRQVPEDQIAHLLNDKIDKDTISLLTDNELANYLPAKGDRLAVRKQFGSKETRKNSLFEKLKQKMHLSQQKPRMKSSDSDSDSGSSQVKRVKKSSNNALKKTRQIEFGWIHEGKQVRQRTGGGTRKLSVAKTAKKETLLEIGKDLFFPGGVSKKLNLNNVSCDILDFQESQMDANVTIGEIYERVKMGIVRFYLSTKVIDEVVANAEPDLNESVESNTIQFGPFSSTEDEFLEDTILNDYFDLSTNPSQEVEDSVSEIYSEDCGPRSPTPPPLESIPPLERIGCKERIKIHRVNVLNDMVTAFKDPDIADTAISFSFIGERGSDVNGLSRDVYCAFWNDFFLGNAEGEDGCVPCLNSKWQEEEWSAIGRILLKGYVDHNYYPLKFNQAFTVAPILGEEEVTSELLVSSFLSYISRPEKVVVNALLEGGNIDDEQHEEFLDLLERMGCSSIPTNDEIRSTILQLAHKQIIQKPKYAIDKMAHVSRTKFQNVLPCIENITFMYNTMKPTCRKVLKTLVAHPTNKAEDQSFKYLQQYIRALDYVKLGTFLRFVTGSDTIISATSSIQVQFSTLEGVGRHPVAHTCGPTLELPSTYTSYPDFRKEFEAILGNEKNLEMDIV